MIRAAAILPAILGALTTGALAAGHDWMTPLDGTLPISQLSIPGTHDSGARVESFPGTAKCQNLTIGQQLDAGVRFLDIRCRHLNDAFAIYHGSVDQNLSYTDVLAATYGFLAANPGETVIMSIKEEHTASGNTRPFEATFDAYVALNPTQWLLDASIPTLDQARGKIVLFRRFGATGLPKGINASAWPDQATFSTGGTLRVQDEYQVSNNDTKWSRILALLNEARYGGPDTLHVNFASGYTSGFLGIPSITSVSNNINPRLSTFFTANPSGRFGTILMDFADAARCALIYQTNAPAGRAVHHPAYFTLINRNSGKAIDLVNGNTANGAAINQWTRDDTAPDQRWALAPTENADHFRITSWVSGKCAGIEGDSTAAAAKLLARDYTGNNPAQQFDLIDAGNGFFKIRNVNSGLILEVASAGTTDNARIQQNTDTGTPHQQWRLQPWGDYFIRASTGKYVRVGNTGHSNGDPIVQSAWQNQLSFLWRMTGVTNGHLKAASAGAPGRVISVQDAFTAAAADCRLLDYNPSNIGDQKLRITPKTNGLFKFHFAHSGMAWDIPGGNAADLTPLEQFPDNTNPWQEFQLERLVGSAGPDALLIPSVSIDLESATATLAWPSQTGYLYQAWWSENLTTWHKLTKLPLPGNGSPLTITAPQMPERCFYRVSVTRSP